jgi:hypothetical protein
VSTVREPSLSARPVFFELSAFGIDLQNGTTKGLDAKRNLTVTVQLNSLLERHREKLAWIVLDARDEDLQAIKEEDSL